MTDHNVTEAGEPAASAGRGRREVTSDFTGQRLLLSINKEYAWIVGNGLSFGDEPILVRAALWGWRHAAGLRYLQLKKKASNLVAERKQWLQAAQLALAASGKAPSVPKGDYGLSRCQPDGNASVRNIDWMDNMMAAYDRLRQCVEEVEDDFNEAALKLAELK